MTLRSCSVGLRFDQIHPDDLGRKPQHCGNTFAGTVLVRRDLRLAGARWHLALGRSTHAARMIDNGYLVVIVGSLPRDDAGARQLSSSTSSGAGHHQGLLLAVWFTISTNLPLMAIASFAELWMAIPITTRTSRAG